MAYQFTGCRRGADEKESPAVAPDCGDRRKHVPNQLSVNLGRDSASPLAVKLDASSCALVGLVHQIANCKTVAFDMVKLQHRRDVQQSSAAGKGSIQPVDIFSATKIMADRPKFRCERADAGKPWNSGDDVSAAG